jgi:glyoxylase-like metal-dependent hydrolase (beta-lactamase superfamily II)
LTRRLDGSDERPQALVAYIESMRKTREMPAEIVLSGHGDPIANHVTLIDDRIARHDRHKEKNSLRVVTPGWRQCRHPGYLCRISLSYNSYPTTSFSQLD